MNSEITLNLPLSIFQNSDRIDSINLYNPAYFKNRIPEIKAVAKKVYQNQTFSINSAVLQRLFGFEKDGLLGQFGRISFINFVENGKNYSQEIKNVFGVEFNDAEMISNYFKYIVVEYLFGGLYVEKTANEFLYGYDDRYAFLKVFFFLS